MEDTYLQSDKGIFTDENQMSHTEEERSKDTFDNSDSLTTHQIPNMEISYSPAFSATRFSLSQVA